MSALAARRYALARAYAMTRERPLAFFLGVLLAAAALALPLALASVFWAAQPVVAGGMRLSPEVTVFVAPRATPREVDALRVRVAALPGVAGVELRAKDAALAALVERSGFGAVPFEPGANPLPDVLIARLAPPVTQDAVDRLGATVKSWPLVDSVRSDLDWYRKVQAIGRLGLAAAALSGGLLVGVLGLILFGAARLHAATRAEEVAVLQLVGATPGFIARPYGYSGALTLGIASAFACVAVYAAHAALGPPLAELTALYGDAFRLPPPEPMHLLAVIAGSVIFGWAVGTAGARLTLRR